ncbi:cellular tumor antigen p53-like [Anopheles maculipalpis]|uniref:cellular tumor antigen p53-like n=1 Tax=Anopheles maculipalpis TaxID=1496333 RepID=UPI002158DE58|nr:cellular tumor antigen p53-like [Anopheles maculipalpis]XP_050069926.1 cellular tumor antigen p53-like [Anopheles maculipalpis]
MDMMLNAELFGDINTGSCQNMEDCQTLFRMNTNELLPPPQGGNIDETYLNEFFRNNGIVDMQCVKYENEPKLLDLMYGDEPPNHHKKIPTLEDYTHPLQQFTVGISGVPCSASSWCYSKVQEKLFVKKKTPVTFDVSFSEPSNGTLKLRVMLVYSNTQYAYNTITRCHDDISKDNAKEYKFKEHVVRCLNPEAVYTGRENGVNFEDRLAILVDLNGGGSKNHHQMQQTVPVSLEFLCQNSCPTMERRGTTLLFTLENEHGTLLGRKSISVKICSCPKRDMEKEDKKASGRESNKNKRKRANETVSSTDQPSKKLSRQSVVDVKPTLSSSTTSVRASSAGALTMPASSSTLSQVKREPSFTTLGRSLSTLSNSSTVDNDSSAVVLTLRLPDIACAADVAMYAFKHLSSILISCKDEQDKTRYAQYLSHCRRVRSKYSSSHH